MGIMNLITLKIKKVASIIKSIILIVVACYTSRRRFIRLFKLQLIPTYWHILAWIDDQKLNWGRWQFRMRTRWRSGRETGFIVKTIIRAIILPCAKAIFAIFILWGFTQLTLLNTSMPNWIKAGLNDLKTVSSQPATFDSGTYVTLLSTLASIAGTFLGLYFTAISLVLSTSYADAPDDVRKLLMKEKTGNIYTDATATLLATCILLLGLHSCGIAVSVWPAYILLFMLGTFTILGFVFLGENAFRFFDSTALSDLLEVDLKAAILGATPKGFGWKDAAFQDFYRRQAIITLNALESVVRLAVKQPGVEGDDLARLGNRILLIVNFYTWSKGRIPAQSYWFEKDMIPTDWLTASYAELLLALQADSPMQNRVMPDPLWFEKRLFILIVILLEELKERDDMSNAVTILNTAQTIMHYLGQRYAVNEALLLHRSIGAVIWPWIKNLESKWGFDSAFEPKHEVGSKGIKNTIAPIALIDNHGSGLTHVILGLQERLENLTENHIDTFLQKVDWKRRESLYHEPFPNQVWSELEQLQGYIEFEVNVEGHAISPAWLQKQIVARGFTHFLNDALPAIVKELENGIANKAQALLKEERFFEAGAIGDRGLEVCHKMEIHIQSFGECYDRLVALRRVPDGLWPEIDWKGLCERVHQVQRQLIDVFAALLIALMNKPRPVELPDYFGHAFTVLISEIHLALMRGDEETFKRYFPLVKSGAWAAHDRVVEEYKKVPNGQYIFAHSTEPIINILAISGLALIYSELQGKAFWEVVEKCWNDEMRERKNVGEFMELLSYATNNRTWKAKGAWNLLRVNWKQALEHKLQELGYLGRYYNTITRKMPPSPQNSSQLIRRLTRHGFDTLFAEPEDIFIAHFLAQHPQAKDVEWDFRVKSLLEDWNDEEENEVADSGD
jgi:hypothetical protein